MPSYDAIMEMITDTSKESVLIISLTDGSAEPLMIETVGDVYMKNMGSAVMMIYITKSDNCIVKRLFDPAKYDVCSKRVNPTT